MTGAGHVYAKLQWLIGNVLQFSIVDSIFIINALHGSSYETINRIEEYRR